MYSLVRYMSAMKTTAFELGETIVYELLKISKEGRVCSDLCSS